MDKQKIEELIKVDLFKELDLESLPPEIKMKLLEEAGQVLTGSIWLRILGCLTEEKQEELDKLMEKAKIPEEIEEFLKKEVPNFEEIIKEEIARYKELVLAK